MEQQKYIQGSLFEDDYLVRSLGNITTQTDIALTELVANAWDAGATEVKIFIPEEKGQFLIIEDNGIGLTQDEFRERWMKLRYNRLKHQGREVIFPDEVKGKRIAYGRNGVGRHGLLCFNDWYFVQTIKNGKKLEVTISSNVEGEAFAIINENISDANGHGTLLKVVVQKNLPSVERIRELISARFLLDPQFKIEINKKILPLEDFDGLLDTQEVTTEDGIKLTVHFIDSKKAAKKSIYQGIAFWQRGRLVGNPSWILGDELYIDGRTTIAKRYTVVVKSTDLEDIIKEDWSGFKINDLRTKHLYETVAKYVNTMFETVAKNTIEETKATIKKELKNKLKDASPLTIYEIDEVIESISINTPTAKQESISVAVEAIINLEKSKNGQDLLAKLSKLSDDDISGLNMLLEKWSIKDALIVLNEIDRRISIIEAVRKLSPDNTVDELHILHPLVTESRWLFGPEYDSAEYVSNKQLQTVVKQLFKKSIIETEDTKINKRPDIVVLANNSTLSVTGIEEFYTDSKLVGIRNILIIELKRGAFKISRDERNQAQGYVEDLLRQFNNNNMLVTAYVVGDSIADNIQPLSTVGEGNRGKIYATTFTQLVDTAERRMFGLREKLSSMYDDIPGMELYRQTKFTFK